MSKILKGKCRQKRLDHAKQSAIDALKSISNRAIQKIAEATGDLIDNKVADRIAKVSKTSAQNNLVTNEEENIEYNREIHRERHIYLEQRDKIIDDLKLI